MERQTGCRKRIHVSHSRVNSLRSLIAAITRLQPDRPASVLLIRDASTATSPRNQRRRRRVWVRVIKHRTISTHTLNEYHVLEYHIIVHTPRISLNIHVLILVILCCPRFPWESAPPASRRLLSRSGHVSASPAPLSSTWRSLVLCHGCRRPRRALHTTSIMKAFVVKEYAHPSKIPLSNDFPEPKPGPGQVLVDVYSAGLNFFDVGIVFQRSFSVVHNMHRSFKPKESTRTNLLSHS